MYIQIISIFSLSLLLGMRHATDADHVVAVTTILARQKKGILSSALIGILWGIGHSVTVTLVGIPIILFSITTPPGMGAFLEFLVGLMLVILGILNLSGITSRITTRFTPITIHKHLHSGKANKEHSHIHLHLAGWLTHSFHHLGLFQTLRPVVIGLVHGLAGSAAIALLILSTIKSPLLSLFYLLIFHIGVLMGMMLVTLGIGASVIIARRKSETINHYLVTLSGILSLIFGFYIIYQQILTFN